MSSNRILKRLRELWPPWPARMILTGLSVAMIASASAVEPLPTVRSVDVKKYCGTWYEIARYDNRYQRGLVGVICKYELRDDGKISVTNIAQKKNLAGPVEKSTAKAWVVDGSAGAKWEVQFIWPFTADYWIIDLADDYSYAVVGQPSRDNLWILSRTRQLEDKVYERICKRLKKCGYDPAKLKKTPQPRKSSPDAE